MIAALRCVQPQFQWYQLAYATEIKSIQMHDSIKRLIPKIVSIILHYILSDRSWWGHFSYSSWFICCLRYCRSFHPSSSSSTLVSLHGTSLDWFSSYLTSRSQAVSIQNSTSSFSNFLWCTSRFRPWSTSFHSLYNSSWLCHLKELNQIPPLWVRCAR